MTKWTTAKLSLKLFEDGSDLCWKWVHSDGSDEPKTKTYQIYENTLGPVGVILSHSSKSNKISFLFLFLFKQQTWFYETNADYYRTFSFRPYLVCFFCLNVCSAQKWQHGVSHTCILTHHVNRKSMTSLKVCIIFSLIHSQKEVQYSLNTKIILASFISSLSMITTYEDNNFS